MLYSPITGAEDLQLPRGSEMEAQKEEKNQDERYPRKASLLRDLHAFWLREGGGGRVCLTLHLEYLLAQIEIN